MADSEDQNPASSIGPGDTAPSRSSAITEATSGFSAGADQAPIDPHNIPDPSRPPGRTAAAISGPAFSTARPRRKRVSRWDRPPEPHDWRWVVGHIGRALITLGLLMFGFVAYQLWGTGIETARAQDKLKNEYQDRLEELGVTPATIAPATSTTLPAVTTTLATTGDTTPASTGDTTPATAPPDTTPVPTAPPAPVDQDYGVVRDGQGLGVIKIPTIDVSFYYVAGVSKDDLDKGVGHFPRSSVPGQLGNAALAGHRTSHLAPFYDLDDLDPGAEIEIYTSLGDAYVYIVTGSEVVEPSDYHVVTDTDPTKATLTLITCTPIGTSSQRLVIHAELDAGRSSPVGIGEVLYGEADPDASLGGDTLPDDGLSEETTTTAAPTSTAVETTLPAAVPPIDPAATTIVDPATTLAAETSTTTAAAAVATSAPSTSTAAAASGEQESVNVADEFAEDAFQQGWFEDGAAWPHVVGWAALFGLIWFACYRLAKRFRNLWLGIAVSIVPVVVVLYFLYENVNRLLPAAI